MKQFKTYIIVMFIMLCANSAFALDYPTTTNLPATLNDSTTVEFLFGSTSVIPAGSTVKLNITVNSNTTGDNRQGLYCDNGSGGWATVAYQGDVGDLNPGTRTLNLSACNFVGKSINTVKICSGNAWDNFCSSYVYNDTTVLSALTLIVTSPPTVTTNSASTISASGATLNGTVNANNDSTTVTFEYGLDTNYGNTVIAAQSPVTGTTDTAVSYVLSSLTASTTYHYRVVGVNGLGTTNGADQTFTTSGAVPVATTETASGITAFGATLNGTINANNESTTVTFEYGPDTNYGNTVTGAQSPVTGTTDTAVSYVLSGLTASTTYHYRVVGVNGTGTTNGADQTFTTSGAAPVATTETASGITTSGATLNGTINANNDSTTVTFEYGPDINYGNTVTAAQSPVTGTTDTAVSYVLSSLTVSTTYHYRVVGVNGTGTTNGADQTFTTSGAAPVATTETASGITAFGATLNGTINANNESTTVTFEYGPDTNYGNTVTAVQSPVTGTTDTAVSYVLSGLTASRAYHYRVVGVNGTGTTNGADQTFTTSGSAPVATTETASGITAFGATLNGTINANNESTTVTFEYGPDTNYGNTVTAEPSLVTGTTNAAVSYALSGLTASTTYHYQVIGVNGTGTKHGDDQTFTTSGAVPVATTETASGITAFGATLNGTINANNDSTTVTFEYGPDINYGNTVTAAQSPVTGTTDTAVSYVLSSLTESRTYHYRVVGANRTGATNGADQTFTTSGALPVATTETASGITASGATLNGTINANNDSTTVTFEYGPDTNYGNTVTAEPSSVTGTTNTAVSYVLSGLTASRTYHYRVVGATGTGTTNGADQTFTTLAITRPTVTTGDVTSIKSNSATGRGNVIDDGGVVIIARGVCWSLSIDPTIGDTCMVETVTGNGLGEFSATMSPLIPLTTYYVRAFATNSVGTAYGTSKEFYTAKRSVLLQLIMPAISHNSKQQE